MLPSCHGAAVVVIAGVLAALPTPSALGCASCGSGGDDPMVLYPNETDKVYIGVTDGRDYRNVDADGAFATAGGPTGRNALTLAYGHSFSPRFFFTLTDAYLRNQLGGQQESAIGDPYLALRYTVVMASIVDEWVPQVQLVAGYKRAVARSIHQSRELATQLDVFGNGFSETKVGVDVWFGQTPVQFGLAEVLIVASPRTFNGSLYKPGIGSRSTLTIGRAWNAAWRTAAGSNIEYHAPLRGPDVSDSVQLNHSLFLSQDWQATPVDDVRLGLSQLAAYGENKNTTRSNSITLAYMRTF